MSPRRAFNIDALRSTTFIQDAPGLRKEAVRHLRPKEVFGLTLDRQTQQPTPVDDTFSRRQAQRSRTACRRPSAYPPPRRSKAEKRREVTKCKSIPASSTQGCVAEVRLASVFAASNCGIYNTKTPLLEGGRGKRTINTGR